MPSVSSILRDIGIPLEGLSAKIPSSIPSRLNELGLIRKVTTFESISNLRVGAVKKYSESLKSIDLKKYKFYRSLDRMFDDSSFNQQLFNTLLASQEINLSSQPENIRAFINAFWLTLPAVVKKQFNNIIAKPLGSRRLNFHYVDQKSLWAYRIRSSKIKCLNSSCFIEVTLSRNDEPKDFLEFQIPLKNIRVENDGIYHDDVLVGLQFRKDTPFFKHTTLIFALTPVVTKYYSNGAHIVDIGLLLEKNLGLSYQKVNFSWNREIISQTNTDPHYPMCYTILNLQKAMFEQAIFAPELQQVGTDKSIELLKALLNGQIVVIPGFANAFEFTKTISHADFVNNIYPIQQRKYGGLFNGMGQWLNLKSLDPDTMAAMAAITHRLNISVPVIFRKGNNPGETLSHSVLITDMMDEGDHYSLSGYDPNYSFTNDFGTIDKRTMMMKTKNHGTVNLYLDRSQLDASLINLQLIKLPEVRNLIVRQAGRLKSYIFSPNEILHMQ